MTNNMDDFEQDGFDAAEDFGPQETKPKRNLFEELRARPLFKLGVIMLVVGVAIAGAMGAFSSSDGPESTRLVSTPALKEPPGGKASPYFIEQNKQANAQRADQAMQQGGSALPTPVGQSMDISDLTNPNKKDPLMEFRAETERLKQEIKQEQVQNTQKIQVLQQQVQRREPEDDTLARAMQKQMQQLMEGWTPRGIKTVKGTEPEDDKKAIAQAPAPDLGAVKQASLSATPKALIAAGTVNYAQMLTEANSDVPGPVLAQILSGPLAGGRAIGRFQTMNEYLVIQFSAVSFKGKQYAVQAIALDPDTTLGGMATEVDHRYFDRLLLPAAAAFLSSFGQTMGEGEGSTSSVSDGVLVVDQAKKGYKEAIYEGIGQVGETAGQFLQQRANQIKTLVRVAVGTPMGVFFLSPVYDPKDAETLNANAMAQQQQQMLLMQQQGLGGLLASGYAQGANATLAGGTGLATGMSSLQDLSYPAATGLVPYTTGSNSANIGYYGTSNRRATSGASIYPSTSSYFGR